MYCIELDKSSQQSADWNVIHHVFFFSFLLPFLPLLIFRQLRSAYCIRLAQRKDN